MAQASFGSFTDFVGGGLNAAYTAIKSLVSVSAVPLGVPKLGELAASKLPSRIPVGNPNTPAYNVGGAAASVASLALPIADGGDAALGITGLLDHTAPEARMVPDLPAYASGKTSGVLVRSDGSQVPLRSGMDGPALDLPKPRPNMNGNIVSHVEAHAAAIMRSEGLPDATLWMNRMPCGGSNGCLLNLSRMVPTGSTLNVYVMPEGSAGSFADWIIAAGTG